MTEFYIDATDRKRIVTKWVERTLWLLHIWAFTCIVVISLIANAAAITALSTIFSTCTFGIGLTLGVLIIDRGADYFMDRFSKATSNLPSATVTETVTKTVTTEPVATEVKDVNINAQGAVNVDSGKSNS